MNHKVYVMLGFHINFYHSWRGDTPDEAGFGTDIRVIRGVLDILDKANAAGKRARGYWDTEVYWTFQEILPKHSPDILDRMRARVAAGLDEIVLGPYNNGANHAATADEFRASLAWALENPWGSGLKQLFPSVTPYYRPQECMFTTGQESIFREHGIEGLLLYYALVPFNTLAAFTPALSIEERFNPLWFRSSPEQPRMALLPAMSAGDVIDMVSLESMLLDLHQRQQRGEIQSDVVIHLNEDADLETWLPMEVPKAIRWFPNLGGLEEYIDLVNRYPWADFTVPGEYLASHPPQKEILVRQDLADGAFDGNYSWAEKSASVHTWSILEQSRMAAYRAESLGRRAGLDLRDQLWEGMESSFFQRLIGLSTTHFGMSTPLINEERQARAFEILGKAKRLASEAERSAARALAPGELAQGDLLYEFELSPTPPDRERQPAPTQTAAQVPLILPGDVHGVRLERADGQSVPVSLTDPVDLPDGRRAWQLRFVAALQPEVVALYRVYRGNAPGEAALLNRLHNQWLELQVSELRGIESFTHAGVEIGGADFLQPFVSYRTGGQPIEYHTVRWELLPLPAEQWEGMQRLRLRAYLPMQTPQGEFVNEFTYSFTLFEALPQLYLEVEARYAYTPPTESIHNMIQKLRRLMDLRWVEAAPCQLHPALTATGASPLRVWKHNYLGITAYYDLNYGQINPRNRNLDTFNHHVTAGWVAVSDGARGLLLGENADLLSSMAFCPMRLREREGVQRLWLNPFGSYHGSPIDYSHIGGVGIGADFLQVFSGFMKPNGPSFNGQTMRFGLMLAPYAGDAPPADLQAGAAAHFYPPGLVFRSTPEGVQALLAEDIRAQVEALLRQARIESGSPLPAPSAFMASPASGAANLVWDLPRDEALTGCEIAWRPAGDAQWRCELIEVAARRQISGLLDGQAYEFRLRFLSGARRSEWTSVQTSTPGAVTGKGLGSLMALPLGSLLRMVLRSLWSVARVRLRRREA